MGIGAALAVGAERGRRVWPSALRSSAAEQAMKERSIFVLAGRIDEVATHKAARLVVVGRTLQDARLFNLIRIGASDSTRRVKLKWVTERKSQEFATMAPQRSY